MHDHQLRIDRPLGVAGGVADRRSPGRGFVERALRIGQHRGKLAAIRSDCRILFRKVATRFSSALCC